MLGRPGKEACGGSRNSRLFYDREGVHRMGQVDVGYCGNMRSSDRLSNSHYLFNRKNTNSWKNLIFYQAFKWLRLDMGF